MIGSSTVVKVEELGLSVVAEDQACLGGAGGREEEVILGKERGREGREGGSVFEFWNRNWKLGLLRFTRDF